MKERYLLADAGVLISLTHSCLENILEFLHEEVGLKIIIPKSVEEEVIGRPLKRQVRKYLYSALRIKNKIDRGIIEVVETDLHKETEDIMKEANNMYYIRGKPLHLVDYGESEMLALAKKLDMNYLGLDERTMRMLIEAPLELKKHLQEEFRVNVMVNRNNFQKFQEKVRDMRIFRSSELAIAAYEKGYFKWFENLEKPAFESALYKIRYSGCAISLEEIHKYMQGA